jgi:hypothetical protein
MSRVIEEAADLVADVVPQARAARWIAYAIAALIAAVIIGLLFWWFFIRPTHLVQQAAQGKADTTMAHAGEAAATQAVQVQVLHDKEIHTIERVVTKGEANVHAAAGADASSHAVAVAEHDALCLSASYQSEPDCAALRGDRPGVGPAGRDPGRDPADQ